MQRADLMVDLLGWMTDDERIAGVILYKFREDGKEHPAVWGLVEREFVNGQPVPTPTWTAVAEFLRAQREQSAANE